MPDIIFLPAVAVFTFLTVRLVLRKRKRHERPAQRIVGRSERALGPDRHIGIAMPGSPEAAGLDAIMAADKHFDVRHFITGAKAAYETV